VVLIGIVRIAEGRTRTMADDLRMALTELLRKAAAGDAEFLKEGVRALARALMELEVTRHVGAERYERALTRTGQRND
jgi:transposase-like protein